MTLRNSRRRPAPRGKHAPPCRERRRKPKKETHVAHPRCDRPAAACPRAKPAKAKASAAGAAHRLGAARPAGVEPARLRRLRARGLHAERHRLSLGAHDRRGGGVGAAAALSRRRGDRRARAARPHRAAIARPHERRLPRGLVRLPARRRQRLRRGRGGERAPARIARAAPRPHEGDPGGGRMAGGVRVCGQRDERALSRGAAGRRAPDPAHAPVPPRQRSLRHEPHRGGGDAPSTSTTPPAAGTRRCSTTRRGRRGRWSTRRRAAT